MAQRKNEAKWMENRARWQINVTNGDGQRKTFVSSKEGRKGKLEAERKADEWLDGDFSTRDRIEKLFPSYIQYLKDRGTSEGYWRPYESIGRTWIIPLLGKIKLEKLTENSLERLLFKVRDKGLSEKYIKNVRSCISNFLKYCRKEGLTTFRPENVELPKGAAKSAKTSLQPDEIKVLFSTAETYYRCKSGPDMFIHAYRFHVLTGLRPGELIGLRNSDIAGNMIHIQRSINDRDEITPGKTAAANRHVRLTKYAIAELAAQRTMLKSIGLISQYVFPDAGGGPILQEPCRMAWGRYCAHNGIGRRGETKSKKPKHITPYELRHTYHSINKDMPPGLKRLTMGQVADYDSDANYNHEIDGDLEAAAKYAEGAFGAIFEKA